MRIRLFRCRNPRGNVLGQLSPSTDEAAAREIKGMKVGREHHVPVRATGVEKMSRGVQWHCRWLAGHGMGMLRCQAMTHYSRRELQGLHLLWEIASGDKPLNLTKDAPKQCIWAHEQAVRRRRADGRSVSQALGCQAWPETLFHLNRGVWTSCLGL